MKNIKFVLITLLLPALIFTGCVIQKNPVSGSSRAFAYSWEQEVEIGRQTDQEIIAQYGLYDDANLAEYVNNIGEQSLAVSHMRRADTDEKFRETEFYFRILDSPVINAFALPGGYVYMTRGLMAHLNNEAQFSVVMGHEIGHVAARHASQRALRQTFGSLAAIGGAVVGQEVLGLPGESLLNLSSTAAQLIFLSYSRENERESDELGVEYAAMNEYVAAEGAAFFTSLKRLSDQSGQEIPSLLSTHPDPGERENRIPQLAQQWEGDGYQQTVLNRDEYMQMIDGIIFGENPRHGFERDGTFHHPDLAFRYSVPNEWMVNNQQSSVTLLSPQEDAVSALTIDTESGSVEEAISSLINQEGISAQRSGPVDHPEDGLQAYEAVADAALEDGTSVTLYLYAVEYDNNIYRYVNYTFSNLYNQYTDSFQQITQSFQAETDSEILSIEPVRLSVFRATRSGAFSSFVPQNLPDGVDEQSLAILNQVESDTQIEQGDWLKIPVQ